MNFIRNCFLSIILGTEIVTLPLIPSTSPGLVIYGFAQISYILYALIIISIAILAYRLRKKEKRIYKVNYIDVILAVYLTACLLNILFIKKLEIDPVWLLKYGALTLTYIIARSLNSHSIIYNAVIISGCVQSCISFGQHFGMMASYHEFFPVTGTFDNPGPLGGYFTISLIISIILLISAIKQKQYPKALLYIFGVIFIGTALLMTSSRAAYLSVGVALFYFLYKLLFSNIRSIYNRIFILTAFAGTIAGCKLLYDIQPGSANARLLIWHVSATMIAEKPFFGHGIGAFGEKYMIYQAKHFENNPESSFSIVADNPLYAYNEIINVGIEQGIVGLLIVFALIFIVFFSKHTKRSKNTIPQTALLGWLVFCLFSYPSDIFPILILLPVLMAFLDSTVAIQVSINTKAIIIGIWILIGLLAITFNFYGSASNLSAIVMPVSESDKKRQISDPDLSLFIHNHSIRTALPIYAKMNDKNLYKRIEEVADSYYSFLCIGDFYADKCAYKESEYYYTIASNMIPNRILPNYCLWQLALKTNDIEKASYYANKIIGQQVKVANTFTIRTKSQMMLFLKEQDNEY